ncbi:MAG: type 1 glutamine amidotransferase [Candidatus Caenarcaniphilales bacterium]|nr:type 1 glutamine amidotransferase [Candidatus Caenarcaniphilales bacterium]
MQIHSLEHVPFESIGCIAEWLKINNLTHTSTKFYENSSLPSAEDLDFLIVMGGPMGVNDENDYPWISSEKEFIKKAIDSNKKVLGICLGAQLIADVLGARVFKNEYKEIGFFKVNEIENTNNVSLLNGLENGVEVFHWHGDTFSLPEGSILLASSEGCSNQAFAFNNNVLGLQFHLEMTLNDATKLIDNSSDEDYIGKYVQRPELITSYQEQFVQNNKLMFNILDRFIFPEKTSKN